MIEEKEIKVSKTDPDSGYMQREGKPEGFYYLDHRTVDKKHNIITDAHVTAGNVHDSIPYIERLERQIEEFGFQVEAVALDSGYLTAPICKALHDKEVFAVIAHRRFHSTRGLMPKSKFKYNGELGCYICPKGQMLKYRTTSREGYQEYISDARICKSCPRLAQCTRSQNCQKVITRHVWEDSKEWVRANRLTEAGDELYHMRHQTIERSFADSKQLHGLRYCRFRGREHVQEQVLLTAACQNMKKIATILARSAG